VQGDKTGIFGLGLTSSLNGIGIYGTVEHRFNSKEMTILNITTSDHGLFPGIVSRTVVEIDKNYYIMTYGIGNATFVSIDDLGFLTWINDSLSTTVWGENAARIGRETIYEEANGIFSLDPRISIKCFPAHTRTQTSRTTSTAISDLRVGDVVAAFDARADKGRGALVPRRVTRLYRNTTAEWIRLRWSFGTAREGVGAPKPCVLDLFGQIPFAPEVTGTGRRTRVGRNRPLKRWGERWVDTLPVAGRGCSAAFG
jgi:hypothetical protein